MATTIPSGMEKAFMAVDRVQKLFKKVTQALNKAKIPYAVVGGQAVAAWVATVDEDAIRFTKDVDLLVDRKDLRAMTETMKKIDLIPIEVLGITMYVERKNPTPKRAVHLIFAGEIIRSGDPHPAPTIQSAVKLPPGIWVVGLPALVTMKLLAHRHIDLAHILDMKSIGLINEKLIQQIPADLRAKLIKLLEEHA